MQDEGGYWHDAPARPVKLEGGASALERRSWSVPENPPPPPGYYNAVMTVWSEPPENATGDARLDSVESEDAFRVANFREDFESLEKSRWNVSSKELGRGRLEPENVTVEDGSLRLKLPAGTLDGGEIESRELYQYGTYRARIRVANAPSSITGFFLYREPDLQNELDVEIFNDSSGRILFTSYSGGRETNTVEKELPFDPTAKFHEYRFDFYPEGAEFYVDGELLHRFDGGLPEDPMKLYLNAWFPKWLSGEEPGSDRYTRVDYVRH